jgi:hypothetical protein
MSSLTQLEDGVDATIDLFMHQMHKHGTQVVDLGLWLQLLAFGRFRTVYSWRHPTDNVKMSLERSPFPKVLDFLTPAKMMAP